MISGRVLLPENLRPSTLVILRILLQNKIFPPRQRDFSFYIHFSYIHHPLYLSFISTIRPTQNIIHPSPHLSSLLVFSTELCSPAHPAPLLSLPLLLAVWDGDGRLLLLELRHFPLRQAGCTKRSRGWLSPSL
jgi:hypothetical protein